MRQVIVIWYESHQSKLFVNGHPVDWGDLKAGAEKDSGWRAAMLELGLSGSYLHSASYITRIIHQVESEGWFFQALDAQSLASVSVLDSLAEADATTPDPLGLAKVKLIRASRLREAGRTDEGSAQLEQEAHREIDSVIQRRK